MKKWAVLLALASIPAHAADAPDLPSWLVLSLGVNSCGMFVAADPQTRDLYLSYTVGFITGTNYAGLAGVTTAGRGWDRDSALLWLDNYCRANPLDSFINAASGFRLAMISAGK